MLIIIKMELLTTNELSTISLKRKFYEVTLINNIMDYRQLFQGHINKLVSF